MGSSSLPPRPPTRKRSSRSIQTYASKMAEKRFKEVVTQEDSELLKGPPGFEYQWPDDTLYLRWLDHVRVACSGEEVSNDVELEKLASKAVQKLCCLPWASLFEPTPTSRFTLFDGCKIPTIPIMEYGKRLVQYIQLSPVSIIAARIYISRILVASPPGYKPVVISTSNIHRLFLTATLIGAKFFEDDVVSNTYAANVGGIAASELHAVELEFLSRIDYRLNLQPWELEQGLQDIRHHAAAHVEYDAFSKDPVINEFDEPQPTFVNEGILPINACNILRNGDLIVGMTLLVELPVLAGPYLYVSDVGYKMIDSISIHVAGVELDRLSGIHMLIKSFMSNAYVGRFGEMINGTLVRGRFDSSSSLQDESVDSRLVLHVPIHFWFGRAQVSNGFPLSALVTTNPVVKLTLSKLSNIIRPAPDADATMSPRISIMTDNIFLEPKVSFALLRSGPTKSLFQQNLHQDFDVDPQKDVQRIELLCNQSVRRMLWFVTRPDDPLDIIINSVVSSRLLMEGTDVMPNAPANQESGDRVDGIYSNLVQPYLYGTRSMAGVYSQTFALRSADVPYGQKTHMYPHLGTNGDVPRYESPFSDQPTGAFNFGNTRNFLELKLNTDVVEDGSQVHIVFEAYNVLEHSTNEIRPLYID